MIPQNRLIFFAAAIGLPAVLLGSLSAELRLVAWGMVGALFLVAVIDAVLSRRVLDPLTARLPDVTRWQKDHPGTLEVEISDPARRGRIVRLGVAVPDVLEFSPQILTARLSATSPGSRLEWPCLSRERGQFRVERLHIETSSRLGFWAVRRALPVAGEIRVYPNLRDERRKVAALFLSRGRAGLRVRRASGKGRDFEKLRDYVPGDSFDEIHWRASAKRGHPVTKVFQIERTQEVHVIIDSSRLSARSLSREKDGRRDTVLEHFMTAGLILALAAQQQGDLFGMLTFSDRIESFVRARSGKNHYAACRDALYTLQPRLTSPNFEELATFIRLRLRKRSLLVILTALDDPLLAEQFEKSVGLFSRQHLVLVNLLRPPGAQPLFTGPAPESLDGVYRNLGGHLLWQDLQELGQRLQRHGVGLRQLTEGSLAAQLVSQYLDVKARQLI